MYIRENNQESILAYMDYINELFFSYWNTFTIFNGSQLGKNEKGYSWHVCAIKFIGMEQLV